MPPRRALSTMPLDLDFFSDPGVQALYEDNSPAEADGAVVLFLRMLVRAHRLDRPDVRAEFTRFQRWQEALARLDKAGLIDPDGVRPQAFAMWRTPDRGMYTPERQRAGGLARAASGEREGGRFAPALSSVEPALTSVDQPTADGTVRYGTERSGSRALAREVVHTQWTPLAALFEELTGRPYALANPWSKMAEQALGLIDAHGWDTFEARCRLVAGRIGDNPRVDELVFGVADSLRRKVDTADVTKAEATTQQAATHRRSVERTQQAAHDIGQHEDGAETHPLCPACRPAAVGQ